MKKFKSKFQIVNGGGQLFTRQEEYQIIGLGNCDVREEVTWEDNLTTTKKIVVVSEKPFTAIVNKYYWAENPGGDDHREEYQEVKRAHLVPHTRKRGEMKQALRRKWKPETK